MTEASSLAEVATFTARNRARSRRPGHLTLTSVVLVVALVVVSSSLFTVDQGYRGVLLRLGTYQRTAQVGLGSRRVG